MCQCSTTPATGDLPLFERTYQLANLIGECRAVAEALPAITPQRVENLTLDGLTRVSDLASVVARLIHQAEDLAYDLGSDLHDLYLAEKKGH